jgi:hypothetical protein
MDDKYLRPLIVVDDTFAVVKKNILSDNYFAVAPLTAGGVAAQKSYAFDYTRQGAGCYINSFYAEGNGNAAKLNLLMGTLVNVVSIIFEKRSAQGYAAIGNAIISTTKEYMFDYTGLAPGVNFFRAKIGLANGQLIYSGDVPVDYANPGQYIVMPVPATKATGINIISPSPLGESIIITDVAGRKVLQKQILYPREFIPTSSLQVGIYFYRIIKNGQKTAGGNIIIL